MNATILAERTSRAIAEIEAQTRRLGGELTIQPTRGDTAHRHLHMLEAVGAALAGIDTPVATTADESTEDKAGTKAAKGKR